MSKDLSLTSLEAEEIIISSILVDDDGFDEAFILIGHQDFSDQRFSYIFRAFELIKAKQNMTIDPYSTYAQLGRMYLDGSNDKLASSLVTLEELNDLTNNTFGLNSLPSALNTVRDLSIKRAILEAAEQIKTKTIVASTNSQESLTEADLLLQNIRMRRDINTFISLTEAFENLEDRLKKDVGSRPLLSGYREIDATLSGFHNGEVIVVAARPGVGKTAFIMNIAKVIAEGRKNVAFFSLEMTTDELSQRYAVLFNDQLKQKSFRENRLDEDDWARLEANIEKTKSLRLFIDATPGLTVNDIISRAKLKNNDIKRQHPNERLDIILIDYLQLIKADRDTSRGAPRHEQVANISRNLKRVAKDLNIPIIVAAQLNRDSELQGKGMRSKTNTGPSLANLAESSAIEQDADVVMIMYQIPSDSNESSNLVLRTNGTDEPFQRKINKIGIKVEKNRHGAAGELTIKEYDFNGQNFSFTLIQSGLSFKPDKNIKERDNI
ncbi:MAG: AAA family ATPase [Acholeplasmatales bacterium]|jgi:replicative DNA helicase|nr:AAA family ATPase [Acholeplasmatales bacterium]